MGTLITIGGKWYPNAGYVVTEHGTPAHAGDTGGGVGSLSVTVPMGAGSLRDITPNALKGMRVEVDDETYGKVVAFVVGVSEQGGMVTLDCLPRTLRLNIFGVRAEPFKGTLYEAFDYYLGLAKIPAADRAIANEAKNVRVALPGWGGELWLNLKMLAAAFSYDINTAGSTILIEPQRKRTMDSISWVDKSSAWSPVAKAQFVEVWQFPTRWSDNFEVHPINASDSDIVNIKAGEQTITKINLAGSIKHFVASNGALVKSFAPTYWDIMSTAPTTGSRFLLTYGGGTRVKYDDWRRGGGRLVVSLDPGGETATVTAVGPTGLNDKNGNTIESFSVSFEEAGLIYNGLRLRGAGVGMQRVKHRFATGVPASDAETEVGVTVENRFISSWNQVAQAGIAAATLSSTGAWNFSAQLNSMRRKSGSEIEADQVIGTMGGVRFYDERTRSFYRVREASVGPLSGVNVSSADLDNTVGDLDQQNAGKTVGQIDAANAGKTVEQIWAQGVGPGTTGIL